MDLRYRLTEPGDIEQCLRLLPPEVAYPSQIRDQVAQTFRHLISCHLLNSIVMEDYERPPAAQIVAFGASVFVTPEYMAQARCSEKPGLNVQILTDVLQGRSPLLDERAIRDANSGNGLDIVILHSQETAHTLNKEELRRVDEKWVETFLYVHGGYRIREMLVEARSEAFTKILLGTGLLLRRDYAEYYQTRPVPPDERLFLVGITRAENEASPGQYATVIFQHTPPRCFFAPREQELLRRALTEETDGELARALGLSLSAVKKRWNAVYARVAALELPFLPPLAQSSEAGSKRGLEKRRHLMRYLRQHPEELRPASPPNHSNLPNQ